MGANPRQNGKTMAISLRKRALLAATLLPFAGVSLYGLFVLIGWWTGQTVWVQPRVTDVPVPANSALCLLLLGAMPILLVLRRPKTATSLAVLAALLGTVTLLERVQRADYGIDNFLVNHRALIEGTQAARVPLALAALFALFGLAQAWVGLRRPHPQHPITLALLGSAAGAYSLTGLLAGRIGINQLDGWLAYANLGIPSSAALLLLGLGFILLAGQESAENDAERRSRWLWLPVVTGGVTITLMFWTTLREREVSYQNGTTQLTINTIATLYSGETETIISNLNNLAARWADSPPEHEANWERDIRSVFNGYRPLRSITRVDASHRTRWLWPHAGNEDALSLDHTAHSLRNLAMTTARENLSYGIAAPLISPVHAPTLGIYTSILRDARFDGFIAGEFDYDQIIDLIDRRLNISSRYVMQVEVWDALGAPARSVQIFQSTQPGERSESRFSQNATFNLFGQRLLIQLTPRPEFLSPNRRSLPELALLSGLGLSALLGLIVNLAQAAYYRQRAAEKTSAQLRTENEERRRVEARLKLADERLNLALDSTQVGVYEWDVPSGSTIYSASLWTSLGYNPEEMASTWQTWLDLMHPDDTPAFQASVSAHFQGASPFLEQEFRLRHQNGEWHWLSTRAKCVAWDTRGQPRRVTGTCQDITERRRAEETLRTSLATTRKLSLVASRTDNAVVITKADGTVEWVNESFTRLSELSLPEVTGKPFVDLISSPDTNPHAVARISTAIARIETITTDVLHHTRSGRHYYVHLEVQPLLNNLGQVENFIIIETDVTSRVEVEQQLRRAKSEADSASRAKSEFLASMSHEIRTPMNGVIGMTSLLLDTPLSAEQRDYVGTIRTSGDALLSIINEILDFSKIESGKMELESRPFELVQCVEEALDIFALTAADKNIELACAIDPAVPRWIVGDITRLRQVLVNLLNNAVKFTPKGFITVEIRPSLAPGGNDQRLLLDFFVTDTGIGIPPDRIGALFKPFSQVDSSTTRKYGGTGLGLAICDRLCQLMGGAIDVSSRLGEGSRFRFSIQTEAAPDPSGNAAPVQLGGAVVLAVDDHPVNRMALGDTLKGAGLFPRLAVDFDDAVAQARDGRIQLLIVDHDLAGRPGRDLIPLLRTHQPRLPVILLTGAAEGAREAADDAPNVIRLPKPIKPSILLEFVARALKTGPAVETIDTPTAQAAEVTLSERIPLDILLVEDNLVNTKVALRFLQRLGYAADSVPNGLEAVRSCTQHQYDLVFMDIQMPEMDGLTATREIRSRVAPELQPKIVALTANAVTGDRERCLASGMDDYLSKPVKIEALEKTILKYFGTPAAS